MRTDLLFHWKYRHPSTSCFFLRLQSLISNANAQMERSMKKDRHTHKERNLTVHFKNIYLSMQFNFLSLKPMSYTINIQLFSSSKGKGRKDWFHPILPLNFLQPSPSSFLIKMRPIKSRINWITSVEKGMKEQEEEATSSLKGERKRERDPSITDERGQFFPRRRKEK